MLHRLLRYRDPRAYWRRRGGEKYFQEQESLSEREMRSRYIAAKLGALPYGSVLEIGCGYGKQLKNLKSDASCRVAGIDWSFEQLQKAKEICAGIRPWLLEADAAKLPFRDKSFDLVLTSAVIMHNPEPQARAILAEIQRVGRRIAAHNEDTDVTFTRHGYDLGKTYQAMGLKVLESDRIPLQDVPENHTQFTLVDLTQANPAGASAIRMHYHGKEA